MPRSLLDQLVQINGSGSYDDAVASANTVGVAEAQVSLEGDMNVLRTLVVALKGPTKAWYENPDLTVDALAQKYVRAASQPAGFINTTIAAAGTSADFDAAIKGIVNHSDGAGSSTAEGVILDATFAHKLAIRDHDSQNAIDDGSGNEVYGRLSHSTTPVESGDDNNQLSTYTGITGVTDANTDGSKSLHFSIVDDTGGFFHIDVYTEVARTNLVAHTATYNTIGVKALIEDNTSGIGGNITVDAVTAVDVDIAVQFGGYLLTWYSWIAGTETAYTFAAPADVDLVEILISRQWQDFPWDHPYHPSFHDTTGFTGSVDDDNVVVNGMTDLLVGLTTQAQVNAKVDDLGAVANGQGASLVAIEDASAYYTGTDIEAALNELEGQLGGDSSAAFAFTENNVLVDDDAVYAALEKLDLKWGDIGSVANGEGASLVSIEDASSYFTGTDVEAALDELYLLTQSATTTKELSAGVGPITAGTAVTIPNSATYTLGLGANMDVYVDGQLMAFGAGNDYTETSTTSVTFTFTIKANSNLTFVIRQ